MNFWEMLALMLLGAAIMGLGLWVMNWLRKDWRVGISLYLTLAALAVIPPLLGFQA